jgi:hypothetical protein
MKLLTNLIFEPKGMHDPALAYNIKDTVMSTDGSRVYFALQDVPAGTALDNEDYWKLQIDLSSSKSAMDEAIASFGSYAKEIGTRVRGETAKASGNPVTFLPDASSLLQPVTVLDIKQEGSGDPYPAGGGKNLLPITAKTQTINGVTFTVDNGVITANGTATANAYLWLCDEFTLQPGTYVMSGIPENFDYNTQGGFTDDNWSINRYGVTTLTEAKKVKPYVVIRNGVTASNVVFKLQLEAGSTATAFMPYSNIRPFIGYDKLDLNVTGKNIYNPVEAISKGNFEHHGVTGTWRDDGDLILNGTLTSDAWQSIGTSHMMSGKTYTVSVGGNVVVAVWDRVANAFVGNATLGTPLTFTAASTGIYAYAIASVTGASFADERVMLMVTEGVITTGWQPYQGTLHTVQIGQTVYGGRFDWLTGKLVAEWAAYTLSGEERHSAFPDNSGKCNRFRVDLPETLTNSTEIRCSHFKQTVGDKWAYTSEDVDEYFGECAITSGYVRVLLPAKTESEAQAYFAVQSAAGTPVQIVYKLATPIEIQLTPHIISAAEPEQTNTLYGDGRIDVEYVKPLHVSIEERVAAAVAAAMNTEGV